MERADRVELVARSPEFSFRVVGAEDSTSEDSHNENLFSAETQDEEQLLVNISLGSRHELEDLQPRMKAILFQSLNLRPSSHKVCSFSGKQS
jgi:hypothetical protein